jgi:general transcriptional corepressor TUP1
VQEVFEAQISELRDIREEIQELERTHISMRQQCEREVSALKTQLEKKIGVVMKGSNPASAALLATGDGGTINGAELLSSVIPGVDSGLPHVGGEDNAPAGIIERELGMAPSLEGSLSFLTAKLQDHGHLTANVNVNVDVTGEMSTNGIGNGTVNPILQANREDTAFSESLPPLIERGGVTVPGEVSLKRQRTSSLSGGGLGATHTQAALQVAPAGLPAAAETQTRTLKPAVVEDDWDFIREKQSGRNVEVDLVSTIKHDSIVCSVAFSNDGTTVVTGTNRRASVFNVENGLQTGLFDINSTDDNDGDVYVRSVCINPERTLVAAGAEDAIIRVWNLETGQLVHRLFQHEQDIYSLVFSPDGSLLASGSGDKSVKVWDSKSGRCLFTLGADEVGPKDGVTSVDISPDGRLIAAASLDRIIRVWDLSTGYFLERYEGHADSIYSVTFSRDGKSLASGSWDKTIKLWDLDGRRGQRGKCRTTLLGHSDYVVSVTFDGSGQMLWSGSKDRSLLLWDLRDGGSSPLGQIRGHRNSVISVAASRRSPLIVSGSGDMRARIWRYQLNHGRG